jgi:glycosyltransferase involved in cell wall biosynthesis
VIPKLAIITEIIAPYRIPVFNALAKRKELDLHVIFLSENDPSLRQWRVYKEEIEFQYDVLPSWRRGVGKYHFLLNRGVFKALNRIKPDVVLCGGYNYLASWQAASWARSHHLPVLLWSESTASDKRSENSFVEFLKSRFLHLCKLFVVPGRASLDYLKGFGILSDRIFTVPNAVDTDLFSRMAEETRNREQQTRSELSLPSRYFLFVGRLVRAKGVFDLLQAYEQMDPEVRREVGLVLVGDGGDRFELIEQGRRIHPGTIQFVGFVDRDGLPAFYALADALVLPTRSDPWGLVVNEAMSCSLPVIVTNVAGCAPDLVLDGWNGLTVDPQDISKLSSAMSMLATDSTLRAKMGARSRQRIESYSPGAWAEGIVEATRAACQRKS